MTLILFLCIQTLAPKRLKNRVNKPTANNEIAKSNKFIPETKIMASQTDIINNVCPKSG